MKGLILKDFCNAKAFSKQYLIILIIMAACAFGTKNLAFLTIYIVILGGMQCITTMNIDENCGFNKFAMTTPIGARKLVGAKYLFFLSSLGIGWLVAIVLNILVALFPKEDMGEFAMHSTFVMVFCLAVCFSVSFPFLYKYGVEKARYTYIIVVAIAFALIYLASHLAKEQGIEQFFEKIPTCGIDITIFLVGLAVVYLSYYFSVKEMLKKEW